MLFWKIDDETIRCLINRDEIGQMGYDMDTLSEDVVLMDEFLNAIVRHSKDYLSWNTDNGIQTYFTRALPADQFLITISCTFTDDIINRDLDQISLMTDALTKKITRDRIDRIYTLTGSEKEEAFRDLAKDLHDICMGNVEDDDQEIPLEFPKTLRSPEKDTESKKGRKKKKPGKEADIYPSQKMVFSSMDQVIRFCTLLDRRMFLPSSLYRYGDQYVLLVSFPENISGSEAASVVLVAEEYGAVCSNQNLDRYFYSEHGKLLMEKDSIRLLHEMGSRDS